MQIQSAGSPYSASSIYADASCCASCSAESVIAAPRDEAAISVFSEQPDEAQTGELHDLYTQKTQAESELSVLKGQRDDAQAQINARKGEIMQEQQGSEASGELQNEYAEAQAEYAEAQTAKNDAQRALKQISQESVANSQAINANAQQKQQVSSELNAAQSELSSLAPPSAPDGDNPEAQAGYQAELSAYNAQKSALESRIASLSQQLQQLESETKQMLAEKAQLAQEQQNARTEINQQNSAMLQAQAKMDAAQQKQTDNDPELQQAIEEDGDLQAIQEEYTQLNQLQAEKEAELSRLEAQIAEAEAQDGDLQTAPAGYGEDDSSAAACGIQDTDTPVLGFGETDQYNNENWDDIVRSGANTSSDDYPFEKWDKYIRPDYKEDQSSGENKNNSLSQYQIQLIKERAFNESDPMLPDMLNQMQKEGINIEDIKIISATKDNDNITVYNNKNGEVVVSINGKTTAYSQEEAQKLLIDAGDGDDSVVVDADVAANIHIYGGDGDDYLQGGGGSDVIYGGWGSDTMYGLSGSDTMYGGQGKDYIDGGRGNDTLYGGEGSDNLIGGRDNDKMYGGEGRDLLIGASGSDIAEGQEGSDRVIADSADTVVSGSNDAKVLQLETAAIPDNFRIEGNSTQIERIESDFEFLASTENGQMLFNEIADSKHTVTVQAAYGSSYCKPGDKPSHFWTSDRDSTIGYKLNQTNMNNGCAWSNMAPVIGLFHEMCHAYNYAKGNMNHNYYDQNTGSKTAGIFTGDGGSVDRKTGGVYGGEWQAVGIDNENIEANPDLLTENGLRDLLDYQRRTRYY